MKKQNKIYGIIGLGKFGKALAYKLAGAGAEILAVDRDETKVTEIREITENAFIARTLEKKALSDMGFQNCDVVILCIAEAIDVSILTVMKLQNIGVKRIIAKANSLEHGEILKKLGVEIVYPEQDMALRLANTLEMGQGFDFIELSDSIKVAKFNAPKQFVGKTVLEVSLREKFGLNIIAIENNGAVINAIFPDYAFKEGDVLYLCGSKKAIVAISDYLEKL